MKGVFLVGGIVKELMMVFDYLERPKIKIVKTKSEWAWDIIGYTFYLCSIIFLILNWSELPNKVPAHYNFWGDIDRWGAKTELLILPIVGVFIAVIMQLFERFPEIHNYPERLNKENAREFYLTSRKMLNQLKNMCLIALGLILFETISIALGFESPFRKWFLPIILLSLSIPIILGIINQKRIR